jgi:hypothetical protein
VRHPLQKVASKSRSQSVCCFSAGQRQASLWILVERIEQKRRYSRGPGEMPSICRPWKDIKAPMPGGCSTLNAFALTLLLTQFEAM